MITAKKFSSLFASAVVMMTMLTACNDDNDNEGAINDSTYTDPNDTIQNNTNGVDENMVPGERGNNEINEGTIRDNGTNNNNGTNNDNGTFDDEARDIIDDTEDMIEGKDDHVHDERIEDKK